MRCLILYTTKYGATRKCAESIARHVSEEVVMDTIDTFDSTALKEYDHIILGAPIYAGKPPIMFIDFCKQHQASFLKKPLSLFICGLVREPHKQAKELEAAFSAQLRNHAVQTCFLGGALTYSQLSAPEKILMKMLRQDYDQNALDQSAIRTFAKTISKTNATTS